MRKEPRLDPENRQIGIWRAVKVRGRLDALPPAFTRGVAPVRTLVPGGVRIFCAASKSRSLRLVHRQNMSFRTSAHAGVGISIEFRAAYRHTDRSFATFSGIYPREVVRLTGGLPLQSADWFAMTGNSINSNLSVCLRKPITCIPICLSTGEDRKAEKIYN